MTLTNKTVLITGGKRIGAVVAQELARRGMDVALSYQRSKDEAEATAEAVRGAGRRAVVLQANLSRGDDCASAGERGRGGAGTARRADQHGVGLPLDVRSPKSTRRGGTRGSTSI